MFLLIRWMEHFDGSHPVYEVLGEFESESSGLYAFQNFSYSQPYHWYALCESEA